MKNVIITGANRGIGFYLVIQLLADDNRVAVLDLETEGLLELKDKYGDKLLCFKGDVTKINDVNKAVSSAYENFGGLDYAIHNACKCTFESFENTDEDIYRSVFDVNYFGAVNLTKAVVPYFKHQKKIKIFFTSSGVGIMGFINISPYASSKGAIESLAKCLNIEYKNTGISFHILHPPLTRTLSSAPLPIPGEFMADPIKVGYGLAKKLNKKSFIICHSFLQSLQTRMCYLFPISFGGFLSKMTVNYKKHLD